MEAVDEYLIKYRPVAPIYLFMKIRFIDIWILEKIVITFIVVILYRQSFF